MSCICMHKVAGLSFIIVGMACLQQTCTQKVTFVGVTVIKVACLAITCTELLELVLQSLR